MRNFCESLRSRLLRFLRINPLATLGDDAACAQIAQRMLYQPRVFGDSQRLKLGRDVVLNDALINLSSGTVTFEDFAFCGHGVSLLTGHHDYRRTGYDRQSAVVLSGRDIVVGAGAWLCSNVTVLGPCTIGRNAVVAAGSVVTGSVESDCVYGGSPALRLKSIVFSSGTTGKHP